MRPICISIYSYIKIKLEIALQHVSRDRGSWIGYIIRNMTSVMILFQSCPPFYRNCWRTSTKRSSNWKQFVFACNSAKMRSYISPRSRCLPERYVYYPRFRYSFSLHLFSPAFCLSLFLSLTFLFSLPLPLILPARRLIISCTTHNNFTSNTSHVCLTAFFAPTKLFSCVTLAPCACCSLIALHYSVARIATDTMRKKM